MADIVYKLMAAIGLDTSGLKSGLDESERMINISGEQIAKALTITGVAISGALTAIGAGFVSVVKKTVTAGAEYADNIQSMSAVTGMSTEALQAWAYAAELVDVSVDTVTGSTARLVRSMSSARSGTESASRAFEMLGISVTGEDGTLRDANDVFLDVIDALGQIDSETERDVIAMELFGRSARDLNPLIRAGSGALAAYRQEAEEMGYILDEETLRTLGDVDDAFQRLANVRTTIFNRVAVGMAPGVQRMVDSLVELAGKIDWERIGTLLGQVIENAANLLDRFLSSGALDLLLEGASRWLFMKSASYISAAAPAGPTPEQQAAAVNSAVAEYARLALRTSSPDAYMRTNEEGTEFIDMDALEADMARMREIYSEHTEELEGLTQEDFAAIAESAETELGGLAEQASAWGGDMISSFTDGVSVNAPALIRTVSGVAAGIASLFAHSEPETGPLSNDSEWMPDMMRSFADGINRNKGLVLGAMTGLAEDMSGAMNPRGLGLAAGRGGVHITINVDSGLGDGEAIAERISAELSALFGREAAALG